VEHAERSLIERFVRHLSLERRMSPLTCKHYRRDLESLADWCQ
jgi:site-specific recombinase XerC